MVTGDLLISNHYISETARFFYCFALVSMTEVILSTLSFSATLLHSHLLILHVTVLHCEHQPDFFLRCSLIKRFGGEGGEARVFPSLLHPVSK
jgi:hypothetical protein